jgi:hypothetical protein
MTIATPRQPIRRRRRIRLIDKILVVALLALGLGSIAQPFWSIDAHAARQQAPRPDQCLANLPSPTPTPPSHRVVQLVNCSNQTLLGAANAAGKAGAGLTAVLPREKTWVMEPAGSGKNVLTIDIPVEWEATIGAGATGPRLWARTGCRYDIASDRAQCETGGCGGKYDCSAAHLGASVGTTVSEWTFYEFVTNRKNIKYFKDSPDISAVDGVNLTMDILPVGGTPTDPFDAQGSHDIQWLAENSPLSVYGVDLREDSRCIPNFRLKRSDLTKGLHASVIVDNDGKPQGGDRTVACFSNCARYAFPAVPAQNCDDTNHNSDCYRWKAFCLNAPAATYKQHCETDQDCPYATGCWINPGSAVDHTCQGRAFIKSSTCPENVCTFPYGYVDPKTHTSYKSTQPPFGHCADVTSDPNLCIGDDTLHEVMPKAYTWPNDPQVYGGDAELYRVVFAPGGTTVSITPVGPIPVCSALPTIYGYIDQYGGRGSNRKPCDISVNKENAVFAVAHPQNPTPPTFVPWACNLPPTGAGDEGVICRWK